MHSWAGLRTKSARSRIFNLPNKPKAAALDDHFLLVGSGELLEECQTFLNKHRLTNVTYIPFYNPLSRLINMIDGLVITSLYEGLPIALLETLSLGRPALSTDVGDIKLVLEAYGSGKIVPSRWRSGRTLEHIPGVAV